MGCSPLGSSVHGFSRQEYWSGWPFPSPRDPPDPGIELRSPVSPALQADPLPTESSGKPLKQLYFKKKETSKLETALVLSEVPLKIHAYKPVLMNI